MVLFLKRDITATQDLSAAAMSFTTSESKRFRVDQIIIHASVNISETITITLDALAGANFDTILAKKTLNSEQDFVFRPNGELNLLNGDEIKVEVTAANATGIAYLVIKTKELNA